jgi:hypothetical protein
MIIVMFSHTRRQIVRLAGLAIYAFHSLLDAHI